MIYQTQNTLPGEMPKIRVLEVFPQKHHSTANAATSSSTPVSIGNTSHRSSEEVLKELLNLHHLVQVARGRKESTKKH